MENKTSWNILQKTLSYLLVAVIAACVGYGVANKGSEKLSALESIIERCFPDPVELSQLEDAAADAMVQALGDRWSYYIPQAEYAAYQENKNNSYVGVGITIQQREDGIGLDIVQVEPDGPARAAGIQPGDVLIAVAGESIVGMKPSETRELVQGPEGTQVELTVLRQGEEWKISVRRERIRVTVAKGQMLENNIGLVTIQNFNADCATQTIAQIEELVAQGAQALIFDVRNNGGGYMDQLTKLLDYLLPEGVLVRKLDNAGVETSVASDDKCLELPMAVLINGRSYSAAELFAAALEEYDWAVTVGQKTCGKGYYQQTIPLPDGSAVNLSTGKYMTPNGVNLQQAGGLTPGIEVAVDERTDAQIYARMLLPEEDPQIRAAVEVLMGKNPK